MQANQIVNAILKIAVIGVVLVVGLSVSNINVVASSDLLTGVTLDASLHDADVAYLQASLRLLREQSPEWMRYIEDAAPLVIAIDLNEGTHGRAAIAQCCDARGRGVITFGFRLGQSPDDADQTAEAKQVAFIGTIVHEVTHIRDQRAGRFTAKSDFKSCVAVEKSGLEKQLQVKQALASVDLGDSYQQALEQQINEELTVLRSRKLWDLYCGVFDK